MLLTRTRALYLKFPHRKVLRSTHETERSAQKIVLDEKFHLKESKDKNDDEKILLCVKYEDIAPQLLSLSLLMRNQRLNRGLVALNVVYDDQQSNVGREQGIRLLNQLQQ